MYLCHFIWKAEFHDKFYRFTDDFIVAVLCPGIKEHVKTAFKDFAEYQLDYDVSFESRWTHSGKYVLPCDVVSRIPEDVEHTLTVMGIHGKQNLCW